MLPPELMGAPPPDQMGLLRPNGPGRPSTRHAARHGHGRSTPWDAPRHGRHAAWARRQRSPCHRSQTQPPASSKQILGLAQAYQDQESSEQNILLIEQLRTLCQKILAEEEKEGFDLMQGKASPKALMRFGA